MTQIHIHSRLEGQELNNAGVNLTTQDGNKFQTTTERKQRLRRTRETVLGEDEAPKAGAAVVPYQLKGIAASC